MPLILIQTSSTNNNNQDTAKQRSSLEATELKRVEDYRVEKNMAGVSPTSKRSKLDSPMVQQNSLALPDGSSSSSKVNTNNSSHNTATNHNSNSINHSSNLQLPSSSASSSSNLITGNKLGLAGLPNPNDVNSPSAGEDNRPSASGSGTFATGTTSNNNNVQTDFDAMNDAVGIAGVDIAAEEELARTQSTLYRAANRNPSIQSQHPWMKSPRFNISDFLDKPALTLMVQHIAASFQLKTLEPAILDVLTQAAEARIHSLIVDSIAAKDHRIASCHLRPPPLYPVSPPKGKQKEREPEAMYDQLIYDRPERILSMLARVEGEEERKARLERESNEVDRESSSTGMVPNTKDPTQPTRSSNHYSDPSDQADKLGQVRKEKKRKREGPGQQARNMSEDARARQSNQTAMRSVGGRSKYSWLSGGVVSNSQSTARGLSTTNPIMASLPAPKFAPQAPPLGSQANLSSSQDRPKPTSVSRMTTTTSTTTTTTQANKDRTIGSIVGSKKDSHPSRLGGLLPPKHLSHESTQVGLNDCLFALERERGTGAGRGTGTKTVFKTYLVGNQPTYPNQTPSNHHHPSAPNSNSNLTTSRK